MTDASMALEPDAPQAPEAPAIPAPPAPPEAIAPAAEPKPKAARKPTGGTAAKIAPPPPNVLLSLRIAQTTGEGIEFNKALDDLAGYSLIEGNVLVLFDSKGRDLAVYSPLLWVSFTPVWAEPID